MEAPGLQEADLAIASNLLGRAVTLARMLTGGVHAITALITDGDAEYILRRFPSEDPAVAQEIDVLGRLGPLGDLVPRLVAHSAEPSAPTIITTKVPGAPPGTTLSATQLAIAMAGSLARIHDLSSAGLRTDIGGPPTGVDDIAVRARADWPGFDSTQLVLTHFDYWCGNTLWRDDVLTGIVDWSGARRAPRGVDIAWCRLDLVLLGDATAADLLVSTYEEHLGEQVHDVEAWDRHAAAKAYPVVESWSTNYRGIGRQELEPHILRQRLEVWVDRLLASSA